MVAFVPISPAVARQLLTGVSAADESALLSDFVEAGLIKAYARVIETLLADGGRNEVRDARIPRPLWKRIVAEGKVEAALAGGSVKLDGDGLVGGRPAVVVTGVRFNEANVRDALLHHSAALPVAVPTTTRAARPQAKKPAVPSEPVGSQTDAPPLIEHPAAIEDQLKPNTVPDAKPRATLPDGDVMVSIADTMEILDLSRGTTNNMIKRGTLNAKKIGARTLIPADNIRTVMKDGA